MARAAPVSPMIGGALEGLSGQRAQQQKRSSLEWLPGLVSNSVRAIDCAVLLAAAAVAYFSYVQSHPRELYIILTLLAAVMQLNIFHFVGLYHFKSLANAEYQIGHVILAVSALFLALLATLYLIKMSAAYSRGWMIMWFVLTVGGLVAVRAAMWPIMQVLIRRGYLARRVAIVGGGMPAQRLIDYLAGLPDAHIQFLGMFDDRTTARDRMTERNAVGTIDDLCELARLQDIDSIIIAMPDVSEERLSPILGKLKALPTDIRLCRDMLEYCLPQSSYEFCGVIPLLRLYDKPVSGWGLLAKTIEDKVLSGLLVLLVGPLMLSIALLIKIDSPGPVFFKQKRYGFGNRPITVWKFRTMYHDQTDQLGAQQVTKNDPRVTRIGHWLRRRSLDELPQLINVLLGDMSVVGPRPHPLMCGVAGRLFEEVVEEYVARHRVKPGITGWAQVHGWHGAADTEDKIRQRVKHDLYYIDNWSVFLDLKILLMTFLVILRRDDA